MAKGSGQSVGPVMIVAGPERFLHLEHTREIREALRAAHGDVDVVTFAGGSSRVADILDECRSMGLMVTHKLVIVDEADELLKIKGEGDDDEAAPAAAGGTRTARELLEAYCAAPESAATLLLRAAVWRKGKLDAAVEKAGGRFIECPELTDLAAMKWAAGRAGHYGVTLGPDAATALVQTLGTDLGRLDSELGKLALVLAARGQDRGAISAALVHELVGESREDEVWTLQSGLLSGDASAALKNLHSALEVARHNPVLVGIAYIDLCRKLDGLARGLAAGENERALMGRLKIWNGADRLIPAARTLRPAGTARLFKAAVEADVKQKTGQGDPVRLLEGLTVEVCSALRRS